MKVLILRGTKNHDRDCNRTHSVEWKYLDEELRISEFPPLVSWVLKIVQNALTKLNSKDCIMTTLFLGTLLSRFYLLVIENIGGPRFTIASN